MKIAFVVNTSWNIYNFRMGIIQDFIARGYEIIIIAPEDKFSEKLVKAGCVFYPIKMENKGSNPLKDLLLIKQLYFAFRAVRPDVVLQFTIKPNIYGTLAAQMLNIPVINNISGLGTVFLHSNLTSRFAKLLYRVSFPFPKKVFFQNKDDRKIFVEAGLVKKEIAFVLPGSGVNLKKFSLQPHKKNDPFIFLLIARVLFDKGIIEYIEAIKMLKKGGITARFQLIGSLDMGKLGIPLKQVLSWENEGLIEYGGFQEDIIPSIQMADCIVLPSYREGTAKTLLEAAACGKPLIATDVPGCRELIVSGKNGYLCEQKNGADLAEKLLLMLNLSESEILKMGMESRKLVEENYDEKIVIEEYVKAISEIFQ